MRAEDITGFNYTVCEGFSFWMGERPPYAIFTNPNTGGGVETHFIYVYEGGGTIHASGHAPFVMQSEMLNDVTYMTGSPILMQAGPNGIRWFGFNPNPAQTRFNAALLKDGQETTITGTAKQCFVISLQKSAICNAIEIPEFKYAPIKDGKVIRVVAPPGAIVAIFTER